ncbi:MAG: aromatic ring-hydroxylating dioxygenase subunit alpha [Pseudomonadota bacterium]|nr:aromatic ring-hydroxylating dioxygenase subunit alpha [Pseudomonadota bacterium]
MDIATKSIRTLSSGKTLDDLVRRETREVSLEVMSNEELYQWELENLFGMGWNLLGHESEVPDANDYVVRPMGEDLVIVARDREGKIHVSLNVCPHRGMRVALGEEGNTAVHKCIYHGWAFRTNGDFIGAPVEKEQMHGNICSKAELGLKKARVELYGGLIFATWNHEGPSFEEYLGEAKFYFDMLWNRTDNGLEVLGPPQKVSIDCNWKCSGEQSGGDGFHTLTLHRWLIEAGLFRSDGDDPTDLAPAMYGINVTANGHNARCIPIEGTFDIAKKMDASSMSLDERLEKLPPPGIHKELVPQLRKNLSEAQLELLVKAAPQVGGIFPNLNFLFVYAPQPDGEVLGAMAIHIIVPKGPDRSEFWTWMFTEKDTPEQTKQKMLRNAVQQVGTSGLIEQDDTDTWPHISLASRGYKGRRDITLKYQAILGENKPEGWPGGGKVFAGFSKDDTQWEWWEAYYAAMNKAYD